MGEFIFDTIMPHLLTGLFYGAAWALVALGLSIIFGLVGVINFAHGELYMGGAYFSLIIIYLFTKTLSISEAKTFWVALLFAPILVALVGVLVERFTLRPLYSRVPLHSLILTFGLSLFFSQIPRVFGQTASERIQTPISGVFDFFGSMTMPFPRYRLLVILFVAALLTVFWFFISRTMYGSILRAASHDREMLEALGVNVQLVYTMAFGLSAALAALAGVVVGPIWSVYPAMGSEIILFAFIVVIVGGMGSLTGSVVAAFCLGQAFSILATVFAADPKFAEILLFVLMVAFLVLRPRGIFGKVGVFE